MLYDITAKWRTKGVIGLLCLRFLWICSLPKLFVQLSLGQLIRLLEMTELYKFISNNNNRVVFIVVSIAASKIITFRKRIGDICCCLAIDNVKSFSYAPLFVLFIHSQMVVSRVSSFHFEERKSFFITFICVSKHPISPRPR